MITEKRNTNTHTHTHCPVKNTDNTVQSKTGRRDTQKHKETRGYNVAM